MTRMMRHNESDMQISCVAWMRYNYPVYSKLLEHPKNEGNGNRKQGAISKAEGVQPGVADLILHVPSEFPKTETPSTKRFAPATHYHSLAIEMKTKKGQQSDSQKDWQRFFEAAGGKYVIVRSYDEFVSVMKEYINNVPHDVHSAICRVTAQIEQERYLAEKKRIEEVFGKRYE